MNSLRIYKTLSQLSVYQRNRFIKYLKSPYFNQKKELTNLAVLIDHYIRHTETTEMKKEDCWIELDMGKDFKEKIFRKLCTDSVQQLQTFLSVETFLDNPLQVTNSLLEAIHDNDIKELATPTLSRAERISKRRLTKSSDFYYQQYKLQRNIYNITNYELKRREDSNLVEIVNNLDYFYLAEKIKNHCNLLIRKRYTAKQYDDPLIDKVIGHVENLNRNSIPVIDVYYNVYKLTVHPNPDHYFILKALIEDHIEIFPDEEALELYHVLTNYCISMANSGNNEFYKELLLVFKNGLKTNKLLYRDELEPWDFKNIIFAALKVNEFDWVREFIEKYHVKLNEQYRKNAYAFNKARLYLYMKNFEGVKTQLNQVTFDDFSYKLSAKAMMILTFYELGEFEPLRSFLISFKTFLSRNKKALSKGRYLNYINLIDRTRDIVNVETMENLQAVRLLVSKTDNVANKDWLLEKIEELEQQFKSGKRRRIA